MINQWTGWGVSEIGPSHVINKLPNQDSWAYKQYIWGEVIVISDGIGSHKHSDIGSKMVCESVIEATKIFVSNTINFNTEKIEDYFRLIHAIWMVKLQGCSPNVSSATCLLSVRYKDEILISQLGDGLIIATSDVNSKVLNDIKDDSFSNITSSMTTKYSFKEWKYEVIDANKYNAIILTTDGISDDLVKGSEEKFANSIYKTYQKCDPRKRYFEVKHWLKNWPTPKHTDDKTIACLMKVNKDA